MFAPAQDANTMARKRFLSQTAPRPTPFAQPPQLSIPEPPDPNRSEASDYFDAMERIRTKKGPAVSAYQQALQEQPTAQSTAPSMLRKIGGVIGGIAGGFAGGPAAGARTATDIVERPYQVQMRDYQNKLKGLGESADIEQRDTDSQMKSLASARALGLKYDEYRLKQLEAERDYSIKAGAQALTRGNNESLADFRRRQAATSERQAGTAERNAATSEAGQKDTAAYRRGQLGVAGRNAATGERNASTNAANAATARAGQENLAGYRKGLLEIRSKTGKAVSPSQQAYAVDNALRELATDPRFGKHVTSDGKGGYDMKEDDGSLVYKEFKRRVKALAESSITKGTPFDDEDDSSDEFEIISNPRKPGG